MQQTEGSLVTEHSITLTSLTPLTTYRLMVASTDASGKRVESGEVTFETPGLTLTLGCVRAGLPSLPLPLMIQGWSVWCFPLTVKL